MKKYTLITIISILSFNLQSQVNLKLMPNDSMKVFSTNGISIWGNFYNSGNSSNGGSLILSEGANIIMYGDSFKNINASQVGGGGEIIMTRPRPFPYLNTGEQVFDGGGVISSIPDLTVNSPNNVILKFGDLKVRDSIKFINGHIILNKKDLILGDGTPGVITGYNENRYIVTNGNTKDSLKGYFIRENIGNSNYVFPVGQAIGDYTPAIINNSGTSDNFKVRVFDTVYEDGYTRNIPNSFHVSADERSVQRTWDIRENTKGGSNINLTLQYNTNTEGSVFNYNRNRAFISHFVGYYPNSTGDTTSNWKWDNFSYASTSAPISPGTITTGTSITNAAMKSRSNITSFSPFTITAWEVVPTPLPIDIISFDAFWYSEKIAKIHWSINQNNLIKDFEILKSNNGIDFLPIETVSNSNIVNNIQSYSILDQDFLLNHNTFYYKLKINHFDGKISYSNIKVLKINQEKNSTLVVYPNPNNGLFTLPIQDNELENHIYIYDVAGKLVFTTIHNSIDKQINLNLTNLAFGTYHIIVENQLSTYKSKFVLY